ncbi:23S rRNA (adenine(2503)-C(2))-methyltransferase RlmN [Selenihalanaerobacter shriftii]|uniref:Probable dual-specificity RNA methyltransferase RlmN n=1 Tax=Selenihalanaerobacter shriftii TaxID=142842 RepID=A0A1T4JL85_9FIRM|nr:23S rRNA m(2)A-2503 methyltransferase [Selenihalanaerobacter shriftii]
MVDKVDLSSLNFQGLEEFMANIGEAEFRAKQIANWIYKQGITDFNQMTNLSKGLQNKLKKVAYISQLQEITKSKSKDGTIKYLFELIDGKRIETVLMPYRDGRNSVCVSTQVGCGMGCNFCATGLQGLERNLTTGEIVGQVLKVQKLISGEEFGEPAVTNIVFMGMGEPLANYNNLLKAIEILNGNKGLNIGMRKITLSTCGLVPQIKKLAKEELQLVLAISLHAATDNLRDEMMPVNKRYPINELMTACEYYIKRTNRRITFEYALVDGVNNRVQDAKELAKLLSGFLCHVNLIPVNPVGELDLTRPDREDINNFKEILSKNGIQATVRLERGSDIEAACGQLRSKHKSSD